jgi:UDP:flavonoid glycosyltransferase YjiC (YdhE family)
LQYHKAAKWAAFIYRPLSGRKIVNKRILFISGSIGLGHIIRDIAIANEIRLQCNDVEIHWLAAHPASRLLEKCGEKLLPESADYLDENLIAESASQGFKLNLFKYAVAFRRQWQHNIALVCRVTTRERYDLLIGDETYDLVTAFRERPSLKKNRFVMIYDFVGFDAMTRNPLEHLGIYLLNRKWSSGFPDKPAIYDLGLFVGEPEDAPDRRFGFLLPNRRTFAMARYQFVGYILAFHPAEYGDYNAIRAQLGYGGEKLIICTIGGTSIGKELLELCGKSYPLIKRGIPDVRMILVTGPRLAGDSINVPKGVETREYVPSLYLHLAACDLAIVQAGGTTTLELTALKKPFLYFPIEGHCEQEKYVAGRLLRHRAGIGMKLSETDPQKLAERVVSNIGKETDYAPISADGARNAARLILKQFS